MTTYRTTTTAAGPALMGANTAAQCLAFFRDHNIRGRVIPSRHRRAVLVEYTHLAEFVDGSIGMTTDRILAPRESHLIAQ
jgi:hypothetical protein